MRETIGGKPGARSLGSVLPKMKVWLAEKLYTG